MSRFSFLRTRLDGLTVVQCTAFEDERGFLSRLYCDTEFSGLGSFEDIAQINLTLTRKRGTVRGLHFQNPPYCDGKLVTCISGSIFDVAVDIRLNSRTFLQWYGETLSAQDRKSMWLPPGYAHGFQALTDDCQLLYLHTAPYRQDAEGGLNARDPALAIEWPLPISQLSDRDREHPFITSSYRGVEV